MKAHKTKPHKFTTSAKNRCITATPFFDLLLELFRDCCSNRKPETSVPVHLSLVVSFAEWLIMLWVHH